VTLTVFHYVEAIAGLFAIRLAAEGPPFTVKWVTADYATVVI
jgi:hypothetical protein